MNATETMNAARRKGDWMQTYTGRQFWPIDPRPDEVFIEDIAHALSMSCRFAGHCKQFYSVAEHSVLLSRFVPQEFKRWALMHDASEAYLVDVPRPLKPFLMGYHAFEEAMMDVIADRFHLEPGRMPAEVKAADAGILADERSQNMSECDADWNLQHPALGIRLQFWPPSMAAHQFMVAFAQLFPEEFRHNR